MFPDGPWGPGTHIQRGAITYDFIVPGDPLTPGWASVKHAKRIKPEESQSVPKIMADAYSWRDAKPLLQSDGRAEGSKGLAGWVADNLSTGRGARKSPPEDRNGQ